VELRDELISALLQSVVEQDRTDGQ
jgi:hypothetical protein